MDVRDRLERRLGKARAGAHKLVWGVRTVGVGATIQGSARLIALRVRRPTSAAVHLRSGGTLTYDYPSQLVPALVVFGDLIDPEFEFLRLVSKTSWIVIDVGAGIGQFSVFAARLPSAAVHAFEPSIANIRSLRRNVELNGVSDRVVLHQTALSAESGEAFFTTAPKAYLSRLDSVVGAADGTLVPVRTLSDECRDLGIDRVDVLKINVAGFEPAVLEGADPFLSEGRADVLVLLIGTQSLTAYGRLAGHGYRFFFFHPIERVLHEVARFDDEFLVTRPWPARHVLGVHTSAIERGILGRIEIVRPTAIPSDTATPRTSRRQAHGSVVWTQYRAGSVDGDRSGKDPARQ